MLYNQKNVITDPVKALSFYSIYLHYIKNSLNSLKEVSTKSTLGGDHFVLENSKWPQHETVNIVITILSVPVYSNIHVK